MRRRHAPQPRLSTQRIEAFSDGVFAIAITLLVLEIKIPQLHTADQNGIPLTTALLRLWPSYFGYVFSFLMIGIYWANHHYIFHLYKQSDHVFALLNVFFLMCISFLPFPTAVLAEYITDSARRQDAITFYALGLLLPAVGWSLVWWYASWGHRLIDPRLDAGFVAHLTRQYVASISLYLAAVLLSLWNSTAGLAVCLGLTFLYLMPPKQPVYQDKDA
ncbi:MAG TPA: TMEM175 family protein [Blastocatellia bacterium]|nr:TMEM175 family protein [Blastocatellia bacterium]